MHHHTMPTKEVRSERDGEVEAAMQGMAVSLSCDVTSLGERHEETGYDDVTIAQHRQPPVQSAWCGVLWYSDVQMRKETLISEQYNSNKNEKKRERERDK